jgi:YHS domain-containing protein
MGSPGLVRAVIPTTGWARANCRSSRNRSPPWRKSLGRAADTAPRAAYCYYGTSTAVRVLEHAGHPRLREQVATPGPERSRRKRRSILKRFYLAALAVGCVLVLGGVAVRADHQATCPVSGKSFSTNDKTVTLTVNGQKQEFCCGGCPTAFVKEPAKYVKTEITCPVMKGGKVNLTTAPRLAVNEDLFLMCCGGCSGQITKNVAKYVKETRDPVTRETFKPGETIYHSEYMGVHYIFANEENKKKFDADSAKYANKLLSKSDKAQ